MLTFIGCSYIPYLIVKEGTFIVIKKKYIDVFWRKGSYCRSIPEKRIKFELDS